MESTLQSPLVTHRRQTIVVVIAVLGLYLLPLAGHPPVKNPNEVARIELALAMASFATVDLEQPARAYGLSEDVARRDGRLLADKAPGLSLLSVPVLWLTGWLLPTIPSTDLPQYWPLRHLLTGVLVAVGAALLFFFAAARVSEIRTDQWLPLAVIATLTTPLWAYGTVFFGHAPAAVFIAIAWILLLHPHRDSTTGRVFFIGGASAGAAIATEYPTVLLVGIALVTLIIRRVPGRQLAAAFAGLAVGLLPALVYHQLAFGAPWLTGYAFKVDPAFQQIHATGLSGVSWPTARALWGVLFSSSRGLFFYSPILLATPVGLWHMRRQNGWRNIAPLAAAFVVYLAFSAGFVDWQAGWCAAARHLTPVIPLLAIPTMVAVAAMARHRWGLWVVTIVVAVSATRGFLTLVVTPFFPPEFADPISEVVLPSLLEGVAAPTLVGVFTRLPAGAVWAVAGGLVVALLAWALAGLSRVSSTVISVVLVLVMAVQVGWCVWHRHPPDPRLEAYRVQLLTGLGHDDVARRIETDRPSPASVD